MTLISINGRNLQDPSLLLEELDRVNIDTSMWRGKANAFHYRRGTEPSVGYFLMASNDVPTTSSFSVEVDTTYSPPGKSSNFSAENVLTMEGMAVAYRTAIIPAKNSSKAIYLVKVIDPVINKWSHTYVSGDYNIPIGTVEDDSNPGDPTITTSYDPSTIKEGSGSQGGAYTWKEVLEDITGETFDDSGADFANGSNEEIKPEGLRFKTHASGTPVTVKQALDELLFLTGHTIIRDPDKTLKLIPIDPSNVDDQTLDYEKLYLKYDAHENRYGVETKLPSKVKFRFPKIAIGDDQSKKYTEITKTVSADIATVSGVEWLVQAPYYDNGDSQTASNRSAVANKLIAKYNNAWKGANKNLVKKDFLTYIPVKPDKAISEVIWHYLGGENGPKTHISSSPGIAFPEQSPEIIHPEIIARGIVQNLMDGEDESGLFEVGGINVFSGELESITGPGETIKNVASATSTQTIADGDSVIFYYNKSKGRYEAFKVFQQTSLIEFGLLQNMPSQIGDGPKPNYSMAGRIIPKVDDDDNPETDSDGNLVFVLDAEPDRSFFVVDVLRAHVGYPQTSAYSSAIQAGNDEEKPNDREYRGYARFLGEDFNGTGKPAYTIVYMEHPARMLVVRTLQDRTVSGGVIDPPMDEGIQCKVYDRLEQDIDGPNPLNFSPQGLPEQGRLPRSTDGRTTQGSGGTGGQSGTPYDLEVFDENLEVGTRWGTNINELWYVVFNDQERRYEFHSPVVRPYIRVRGEIDGVPDVGGGGSSGSSSSSFSDVKSTDERFDVSKIEVLSGGNPMENLDSTSESLSVSNVHKKSYKKLDMIELEYDRTIEEPVEAQWIPIDSGGGDSIVCVLYEEVPAAELSAFEVKPGMGMAIGTKWNKDSKIFDEQTDDDVEVFNLSQTTYRGSSDNPVAIVCNLIDEIYVIASDKDLTSLPGFVVGTAPTGDTDSDLQIPFHSGGDEDFKLDSRECS